MESLFTQKAKLAGFKIGENFQRWFKYKINKSIMDKQNWIYTQSNSKNRLWEQLVIIRSMQRVIVLELKLMMYLQVLLQYYFELSLKMILSKTKFIILKMHKFIISVKFIIIFCIIHLSCLSSVFSQDPFIVKSNTLKIIPTKHLSFLGGYDESVSYQN